MYPGQPPNMPGYGQQPAYNQPGQPPAFQQQPQSYQQPGYGAPPSGMPGMPGPPGHGGMPPPPGAPMGGGAPPSGAPPGSSYGGGMSMGGPAGGAGEVRRPQFFNTGGGVPVPAAPMAPPQFQPPPSVQPMDPTAMPPPPSAPGSVPAFGMPGPPRGMPGPPGAPGGYAPPPPEHVPAYAGQMYGAPPPQSMVGMPDAFGAAAGPMGGMPGGYGGPMGYGGVPPPGGGPPGPGMGMGMGGGGMPPGQGMGPGPTGMPYGQPGMGGPGMPGPGGAPGMPGGEHGAPVSQGPPLPTLAETDMNIKCDPKFLRVTVGKVLNSQAGAATSKVPLGILCTPMAGDVGTTNDQVDVVDFGPTGIVRCKRCRTYINPFASFTDNGRKWRCNICGMVNETPHSYFCHLDSSGRRTDRDEKPELSKCSVEFVAPNDYMVRAPQPPVYFFVLDVSSHSASSGMLTSACNAIKAALDDIPGRPRTQIGFITFDTSIHFYSLKASLNAPQMLVVSDVTDITVPLPDDLLVDLAESRAVVEALLDSIPSMFANSTAVQTCTGPALQAAKKVIAHVGGKLCLFQSSLPTLGEGALKNRENPKFIGTDKEHNLLNAEDPWYKENAVDFSRLQVAVDTFLFSGQYTDVATLSLLSKYTSGTCYYYPLFSLPKDGRRFEQDLIHDLTRPTAFEAVMRVRCSRGLRLSTYYGNYFIRGNDLLALPNCTSDSTFAIDLQYEDQFLSSEVVTVQAALLYTSSAGERRIRVHTMVLPVTQSASEMVHSMDTYSAVNLLSKQSAELAQRLGFQAARDQVQQAVSIMWRNATSRHGASAGGYGAYQQHGPGGGGNQGEIEVPPSLQFMPVYAMALQKNPALRGGQDVRLDERAYYLQRLANMDVDDSKVFIYPRLFRVDDMGDDAGLASDNPDDPTPTAGPFRTRLPGTCSLTYKALLDGGVSNGMFLLENGVEMLFRVGRACNPSLVQALFGVPSLEGIDLTTIQIQSDSCDFAFRLNAIVVALRAERGRHMPLRVIKESDGSAEAYFARYLVEDRAFMMDDYDTYFNRLVNAK